jgi:RND family efflux transporter MFP subunit
LPAVLPWLLVAALCSCGGDPAPAPAPRVITAPVGKVVAEEVTECRAFPAQVEARNSVTLASKLSGAVVEISAQEGAALKAGDPIMRIDDQDLQSRSQGLAASMNQAAMERQALAARSVHSRNNLDRLDRLAAQKVISQDDFEKAKSEYQALKSEEEAIAARERAVAAQKDELASLAGYTRIVSPFNGVLVRRFVDLGAFVSAGQPLALVDDVSGGFDLAAQADESLLSSVRVGQTVIASVPGLLSEPFASRISAVIGRIDPGSRTFKLKTDIPAPGQGGETPHAGMFGRVFLPVRTVKKLLLPADCLRPRGDLPVVFTVDAERIAHLRLVKTGGAFRKVGLDGRTYLTDSDATADPGRERFLEVISGLAEGDSLVCGQTGTLREGDRIEAAAQ